jgi:hypothetical protein
METRLRKPPGNHRPRARWRALPLLTAAGHPHIVIITNLYTTPPSTMAVVAAASRPHRRRSCLATEGCSPLAAACIVVSSAEPTALSTSMRTSSYDDAHCGLRMGIRHVPWPSNHRSPLTVFARRPVNQSARLVRFSSYDPILVCLMPSGPWNPSPAAHGSPRVCVRSRRDRHSLLYLYPLQSLLRRPHFFSSLCLVTCWSWHKV